MEWVIATTRPGSEGRVAQELWRHGLPFYLFLRRARRLGTGGMTERLLPAFPRTILIKITDLWVRALVWRITGVVANRSDKMPWTVGEDELLRWAGICERRQDGGGVGWVLPDLERPEPYAVGDALLIGGESVWAGQRGIYCGMVNDERVLLTLDFKMGASRQIDMDLRDVSLWEHRRRRRGGRRGRRYNPGVVAAAA